MGFSKRLFYILRIESSPDVVLLTHIVPIKRIGDDDPLASFIEITWVSAIVDSNNMNTRQNLAMMPPSTGSDTPFT